MVPDAETRSFVFASFEWLLSGFGGLAHFVEHARLVTPTFADFPVHPELEGRELALDYFAFVREHSKIDDELRFELVAGRPLLIPLTDGGASPLPIGFPDEAAADPGLFIAYAARGLSHYMVQSHPRCPPGGWPMIGAASELAAVFSGFGIFLSNTGVALRKSDHGLVGWAPRSRWVLSERALSYALAVFGWVKEVPDQLIMRFLRPNPRAYYRAAVRDLRRRGSELNELRGALRLPHEGPYR